MRKVKEISKRILALGVCGVMLMSNSCKPKNENTETILPSETRSVEFNENWSFYLGDAEGAEQKAFDSSEWRQLTLPHDWSIEQDFTNDVSDGVGHLPGGTGWYRKSFVLPADAQGKRIRIDFGGVYMDSYVYVNGHLMGNYPYGYMPFSYDITDQVVCDGVTENVIAVKVTNPTDRGEQTSRWYSGSGIYRDVHLTITDTVHVATYGSVVTTPNIEKEYAKGKVTVNVRTTVQNQSDSDVTVTVKSSILNYADNSTFVSPVESRSQKLGAGESVEISQDLTAKKPLLWSPEDPNLYTMVTQVLVENEVVDTYDTRFGFRWFNMDKDEGFSLNGKYMKLQGVCLHHDQGALGAVANEAATARQLRIMKEMGVNAIRVTHNPASDVFLKLCDEMGLLVVEEAFDTWYYGKNPNDYGRFFEQTATHPEAAEGITWAQFDLQQMIRRGINFPSIFMWSLGNEVYQSREEKGIETVINLAKWAKEVDTTRYLTMGEDKFRDNSAADSLEATYTKIAEYVDVVGFNYGTRRYNEYRTLHPDWIIYGSETSSSFKSRGYYSDPLKTSGAQAATEYQQSSYDNSAALHGTTATESLIADRDRKWVAGQFVWTGFDYIGEPSPYASTPKSSYFGIVDTAGFAKDEYYLYQSQWLDGDTDPMVHILPHWNWEDQNLLDKVTVGNKVPVRVYSNAPVVELFMNGESLGEQKFAVKTTDYGRTYYENPVNGMLYLEWRIPYEYDPGCEIVAVAKDENGKEIAHDRIVTAGDAAMLNAYADRNVITADGKDLAYITVDVTDTEGNFDPNAMNQLYFSIEGDGVIVGVDNGDPSSWERYKDTDGVWKRKAFNGKALVIVQSTKEAGFFTVTVSGEGLTSASVTVHTKADGAEGVLGYDVPSVTVTAGQQPALPETVTAYYADGSKKEVSVTWGNVTLPDEPTQVTVKGKTDSGADVTLKVNVRKIEGIMDTALAVGVGQELALPGTVTAVWSDGLHESYPVTWQEVSEDLLNSIGQFEITGDVKGLTLKAKARINVKDAAADINVASKNRGTSVTATYEEDNGNHPINQINDGVIHYENGYGNWNSTKRLSDQVTFELAKAYEIDRVTIWIASMNSWQTPDSITIEYWDGNAFVPVTNQSKITGFDSRADSEMEYNGEDITFEAVTTDKIRLTFAVTEYDTESKPAKDMMKINEVEIWSKGVAVDSSAELKSIEIDGVPLEGFDPDVNMYTVKLNEGALIPQVTAEANGNATVFVSQAMLNDRIAQIWVMAEDGVTKKYYIVQFV